LEIRRLIREMSIANPLWGAPRIHGELLKLGCRRIRISASNETRDRNNNTSTDQTRL
jgi:hypothetical protein